VYNIVEVIILARKKKANDVIAGPGKNPENKLTVQKSLPLFSLWQSDMTLAEFKILDTYLSRINSHDPSRRTVLFTKGELEGLLGVSKINKRDLVKRLRSLGRLVDVVPHDDDKIHQVGLFEEIEGGMDDDGLWTVKLTCTKQAMTYVFNIEELGYLRYKLRCITSLSSRYTYVLFMYLERNRFRKTWEVDVDELRQILNCDKDQSYSAFKVFNDRILKRSQKELFEKTECRFTYEPIKRGRSVTAVRFTLETLSDAIMEQDTREIPGQLGLFDKEEGSEDPNAIYAEVLPPELTSEQIDLLRSLASERVPFEADPFLPREVHVANYLKQKVRLMRATRGNDVKNAFSYLKAMIERDE